MASKLIEWFTDRWPIRPALRWSLEEKIPGGDSFWYCLGSVTLFVFVIQVVTGVWQMFWYVPTTDHAYQSVMYIRQEVPFGWLIHGLHAWGSNAFVVLMFLHMLRVFVWGAYKHPRQLTWLLGSLLFFTVLGMTFTGALLPWDELGYWAAEVGTSIAGTVPIVGFFLKELIRGGASMSQTTLSRFFIGHIALLPGVLAALIVAHVVAFRQYGSVGPWREEKRLKSGWFWPDQIVKDLIVILVIFLGLVGLSAFWRAPVTGPADPIDNILTPKPEWQFLSLYQFLKLFKGRWEPLGTTGVPLLLFLIIFLLPFYDRSKKRNPLRRPIAMTGAALLIGWIGVYTYLGYRSNPGASATASVTVSSSASPGVKAGATLFSQQGCFACHTVHGQGGSIGPNLSNIGAQGRSRTWLAQQIKDPKSHDPSTKMPAFSSLGNQQVNHLVDFLESLGGSSGGSASSTSPSASTQSGEANAPSGTSQQTAGPSMAALIAQGKQLIRSQSCLGCHTIDGQGGNIGPDLSKEGTRGHSQQWLTEQIRNPKSHNATTVMPSFGGLSDQQTKQIVAYLESLGTGAGSSDPPSPSDPSNDPNAAQATDPAGSGSADLAGLVKQGQQLFQSQSCLGCHTVNGQGGAVGPNLSKEGTKSRSSQWLGQQLRDPKSHDPQTVMPSFKQLSDQQIKELVAYLQSLGAGGQGGSSSGQTAQSNQSSTATPATSSPDSSTSSAQSKEPNTSMGSAEPNVPATGKQGPPGRAAYLVGQTIHGLSAIGTPMHGKLLFDKRCQRCHGKDGTDHVSNPGSDDGTVPPLNPIDPALYNKNPVTFAENIDRYIQHGSMPDGPHPAQHMPAWGDSLTLTQEMISEIEAYVLKLNGVDRAKIMTPGVQPWVFFLICLIAVTLAISVRGLYQGPRTQDQEDTPENGQSPPPRSEGSVSSVEKPLDEDIANAKESDAAEDRNVDRSESSETSHGT